MGPRYLERNMRTVVHHIVIAIGITAALVALPRAQDTPAREVPTLHHIHHNSLAPDAAIEAYLKAYPTNTRVKLMGFDGVKTSNQVTLLFSRVAAAPRMAGPDRTSVPQDAFWHHVWTVPDVRLATQRIKANLPDAKAIPQYLDPEGATGEFSSDGLPGFLTTAQLAEAKKGATSNGRGGYFNWYGPDGVVMETLQQGDTEAYSIFGMFQEQPLCAVLWYQRHLNAALPPAGRGPSPLEGRTTDNCKVERGPVSWPSTYRNGHYRLPPAVAVVFSGVSFRWYMNQGDRPLVSTRGGVVDHFALAVKNLDEWAARLQKEGVRILEAPRTLNGVRVMMIEGPSLEPIELVETK